MLGLTSFNFVKKFTEVIIGKVLQQHKVSFLYAKNINSAVKNNVLFNFYKLLILVVTHKNLNDLKCIFSEFQF